MNQNFGRKEHPDSKDGWQQNEFYLQGLRKLGLTLTHITDREKHSEEYAKSHALPIPIRKRVALKVPGQKSVKKITPVKGFKEVKTGEARLAPSKNYMATGYGPR
jgi:hypothetical protein